VVRDIGNRDQWSKVWLAEPQEIADGQQSRSRAATPYAENADAPSGNDGPSAATSSMSTSRSWRPCSRPQPKCWAGWRRRLATTRRKTSPPGN